MYKYQRIRDLREDKDLSQEQMAKIIGIKDQTQYSRWERGAYEIPFHHVIKIAKYFNVTIDYIAGLTNTPYPLPKK